MIERVDDVRGEHSGKIEADELPLAAGVEPPARDALGV